VDVKTLIINNYKHKIIMARNFKNIDESSLITSMKSQAEKFYEEYRPQMELFSKSPLMRTKKTMSEFDVYALGKQLESFDQYVSFCEADGSVGDLGRLPNIAYDVITVAYGSSVIPAICTVQPVEEDAGVVYFKDLIANTTKGNITAEQVLINAKAGQPVTPSGYSSNSVTLEVIAAVTGSGSSSVPIGTLNQLPIRPNTVSITVNGFAGVYAKDDGHGALLGAGCWGSIDYTTGVVLMEFGTALSAVDVYASYQVNVELATSIPSIRTVWRDQKVVCQIYALQGSIGMLQAFGVRKKFGHIVDDELASDLVIEMNAEVSGDLIKKMVAAAVGNTNFDLIKDAYVSETDHRAAFAFALSDAEAVISLNAGRGVISGYIGGSQFCSRVANLPGFVKVQEPTSIGPSIYGTYNGATVVRVPDTSVMATNIGIAFYKGTSPFEAPAVYAPFMPLTVTSTLTNAVNPLQNRRAAAVWAAVDVLVEQFITKITLSNTAGVAGVSGIPAGTPSTAYAAQIR
jgi:hypothetical protein